MGDPMFSDLMNATATAVRLSAGQDDIYVLTTLVVLRDTAERSAQVPHRLG